jgi:hypothetical protein
MTWLSEQFGVLPDDANEVIVQWYARAYILEMLGGSVFADTSVDKVHLIWLKFLEDFDTAGEYSWGSVALAWLYRQLCNATKANTKDIGGALILVQLWAWSRFSHMTPEIVSIQPIDYGVDAVGQPLPQGPYSIRYVYIYIYIIDFPWLIAHMLHNILKIIVCVLCKHMNGYVML